MHYCCKQTVETKKLGLLILPFLPLPRCGPSGNSIRCLEILSKVSWVKPSSRKLNNFKPLLSLGASFEISEVSFEVYGVSHKHNVQGARLSFALVVKKNNFPSLSSCYCPSGKSIGCLEILSKVSWVKPSYRNLNNLKTVLSLRASFEMSEVSFEVCGVGHKHYVQGLRSEAL